MRPEPGDVDRAILSLVACRASGATICPSEVARSLVGPDEADGPEEWRAMMPAVHAAVDRLVIQGRIRLSWKGDPLPTRAGPYRIGRAPPDENHVP